MKRQRCVMVWVDTEQRCGNSAIDGDEVCEKCRARVERLLKNARIKKQLRVVLKKSATAPNAKNGHAPASRKPEESL
jgi:hypothetical protein